jgi:DNA repair exonuclease SbcCD ATPase subunit
MNKLYKNIVLLLVLVAVKAPRTYAQLDKAEAKEWKKRMKALTPEEFKTLVEERDRFRSEAQTAQSKVSALEAKQAQQIMEINSLKEQLADKDAEIEKAKERAAMSAPIARNVSAVVPSAKPEAKSMAGVVFKVQVGSFRNKDLSRYFDNNPNFSGEIDADGVKKYTLGYFTDYWEADNFKKYLREMGVKDAWVVSYKDGKRVPIKDVLEGVIQ